MTAAGLLGIDLGLRTAVGLVRALGTVDVKIALAVGYDRGSRAIGIVDLAWRGVITDVTAGPALAVGLESTHAIADYRRALSEPSAGSAGTRHPTGPNTAGSTGRAHATATTGTTKTAPTTPTEWTGMG